MKLAIVVTIMAMSLAVTAFALQSAATPSECVPRLKNCDKPVKWIADKDDCSCFACEYGKSTQHTGCTKDKQTKAEMMRLQGEPGEDVVAQSPLVTLKGTLKAEGDKYTFVSDKGGKSWDVSNPEALKGHEGHHVQLSAHVYADKDEIHVMGVKMLKGGDKGQRKD